MIHKMQTEYPLSKMAKQAVPTIPGSPNKGNASSCRREDCLFETLNSKFRPQHNETILSLQYCKLSRQSNENAEQWMGRLKLMAAECQYK